MNDKIRVIMNSIIAVFFLVICIAICVSIAPDRFSELYKTIKEGAFTSEYANTYETGLNSKFPQKNLFVDINGLLHRIFLQREMNNVILMNNGMETEPVSNVDDNGITANANSLKELSDWLGEQNIHFLYCQVPWKIDDENNLLPAGIVDYSNRISNVFLQNLDKFGVNYLDLRESIRKDAIDRYSLFLTTEHHWKPEGGFYAFQKICDYLRTNFGEEIPKEVTTLDNYVVETYQKGSLGYYGQRTGWMFAGLDDFSLIYPKWDTKQSSWAPHIALFREGNFYDAIFYTDYLNSPWRERGLYHIYIGGDWPVVVHHSETAPIDKTVMILIDSFGIVTESFLTTAYKNVIGLDLRWVLRNQVGKTTVEFVEEYTPDIVIVMFNPNQIGYPGSEQFQYGIDD